MAFIQLRFIDVLTNWPSRLDYTAGTFAIPTGKAAKAPVVLYFGGIS